MKKRIIAGILALALTAGSLTGCQIGNTEFVMSTATMNSKTVFSINDKSCSIQEAKLYFCNFKNLYGDVYGVDLWDYDFKGQSLPDYVKDVTISELTRIVCMDLLAEEHEITLSKDEKELVSKAASEYYDSLSEDEIDYMGVRKADIEDFYSHYALAEKLYQTLTEGIDEEVSDDEARVIRVQQIYVANQNTADAVNEKLQAGEDFETVAASYNEKTPVETTVARGVYPKAVEDVAFNLDNGGESSMITAEDGYYFIKCLNKFEQELTQDNKATILIQREKEQFDDVYAEYLENAKNELNEKLWDSIEINESEAITTKTFFSTYDSYFTKSES